MTIWDEDFRAAMSAIIVGGRYRDKDTRDDMLNSIVEIAVDVADAMDLVRQQRQESSGEFEAGQASHHAQTRRGHQKPKRAKG